MSRSALFTTLLWKQRGTCNTVPPPCHPIERTAEPRTRPYWRLGAGLALSLLLIPLTLLVPLPLKLAVDSLLGDHPLPSLLAQLLPAFIQDSKTGLFGFIIGLFLTIALLIHLTGMALWLVSSHTGERIQLAFRSRLFEQMQRQPVGHFERHGTADAIYRIINDAGAFKQLPIDAIIPLIKAFCLLLGIATIAMFIDWQMALIALVILPLLILLTRDFGRRLRRKWAEVKTSESSTMNVVHEALSAGRVVKAFGRESHEHRRFLTLAVDCMAGRNHLAFLGSTFDFSISMVISGGMATALYLGISHVQAGMLTLGNLLMLMAYLGQLAEPLAEITKKIADVQSCLSGAERAFAVLQTQPAIADRPSARPLPRAAGGIAFEDVSFTYDSPRPVLEHVSFSIPAGSRVGIIGHTGAGKTTLLNLLTRFSDPTSGRILLDGIDLRQYRLGDLRRQFTIVSQEPVLFSTSILENIRYSRPDCTFEQIVEAAKAAHAHDFIMAMPGGYQTEVGDRGARLSGGERQRIALARAFLRDAPILILDEPTSAVDVKTEGLILDAMDKLMRGRTTFFITHRLSMLRQCDMQLIVEYRGVAVHDRSPSLRIFTPIPVPA
jgi:ATP-binding cassette, subfamily B, bacterial